jgi:hypothetical protein
LGVAIVLNTNLGKCSAHIVRHESLFQIVEDALDERGGGLVSVRRKLIVHSFLQDAKEIQVEALKHVNRMGWQS